MSRYSVVTVLLLGTLTRGMLPEDDFRILNGQDLLATDSDVFAGEGGGWYSQLLFDVAREQVIVGARDTLYRLSLRGLKQLEQASWPAPPDKAKLCQDKGQTEADCHNYIKVLLAYGHKLYACGTYAFSPICSWREIESINLVSEWVPGVASCPHNPRSNVTALLTSSGEYYAGTPTDFASSDTAICRTRGAATTDPGMLRTTQYDLNWLNEPQFVGSFEDDRYVYFVFREIAVEYLNCGKTIYSRIARVCKNDQGGHLMMKDNWTTFLKARLKCSVPGDLHFDYDEIQGVEYVADEKILVAVFTTPTNSIAGSAVCIYNMSDVHAAFEGPYKVKDSPTSTWEARSPSTETREHFRCNLDMRGQQAIEYHKYHLMYDYVQPISGEPVYKATLERFTHVTVDVAATKTARQLVAFVATENNDVIKMAILPSYDGACVVEIWRFGETFDVLNMQFVKDTMSVYMGTSTRVVRAAAAHCRRYASRAGCLHAADPHCGWDAASQRCVRVRDVRHIEQALTCPAGNAPVDGGWSSWSEWAPCMQDGTGGGAYGEEPDMCMCRTRRCDNPKPAHGGQNCKGVSISVTNCTMHGGWSSWSAWSACSASCGIAVKSRRRACTSPAPRHAGRVCVGLDQQDMYCSSLPPCPDPALAPVDGAWGPWGAWSACTANGAQCGAGVRERRRSCSAPAPSRGGADCEGAPVERQPCELRPCDVRKATAWTPWVHIPGNTSDGSYTEKRFKFLCKAPAPEQLRLSIAREEERYCTASGACSGDEDGWEAWGAWGACSAPCGGGQQARSRRCRRASCAGPADMLRACNTHACQGEWSCWSDWSECGGGCGAGVGAGAGAAAGAGAGAGHRTRTRMCLSPDGCADAGAALERRVCLSNCNDLQSDVGWGDWGEWGECTGGERVRRRSCASGACVGPQLQVAVCGQDLDNELYAMPAYSQNVEMASFVTTSTKESLSIGGIIGCVIAAFVMGCVVCLASVIVCQRRGLWQRAPRVPSSPHYITAKQNSYVTVPLRDVPPRKAKRQPSFSGTSLVVKSNNLSNNHNTAVTPKLYPKAIANEYDSMGTLRRHSNQPNNKADVEEDKFY